MNFIKKFILLILFLFNPMALASNEKTPCYKNEINSKTKKVYSKKEDFEKESTQWKSKEPKVPDISDLIKAYSIYENEKKVALSLKSDKKAHCYLGCRIRKETSFLVADYVGWLKEQKDLNDCHRSTHFDEDDYLATLKGAEMGENESSDCLILCQQWKYKK